MERAVKCVELTFRRQPSKSHDIPAMLAGLPAQCEIREDLEVAWRGVPQLLKGTILYRGMDHNTGAPRATSSHTVWYQVVTQGMSSAVTRPR